VPLLAYTANRAPPQVLAEVTEVDQADHRIWVLLVEVEEEVVVVLNPCPELRPSRSLSPTPSSVPVCLLTSSLGSNADIQ
jgi:hypothetical protein